MKQISGLLYPFSLIYGGITVLRNFFFDQGVFQSQKPKIPSIGVGNLTVGGTGKSVVVDYLISLFKEEHVLVVISRGYKRKTSGVVIASDKSTAKSIGDEPYQFYSKHKIEVVVAEKRKQALEALNRIKPNPNRIVFDDLMQHRQIKPHCLILTTTYNEPYFLDRLMPWGRLREYPKQSRRAQIILVTKCPFFLSLEEKKEFLKKINPSIHQKVFFTTIVYSKEIINREKKININSLDSEFILITGVANPKPLVSFLKSKNFVFEHLKFTNHHDFKISEIQKIKQKQKQKGQIIITTEKDFGRLTPHFTLEELFYIPIKIKFLEQGMDVQFKNSIEKTLSTN